MNQVDFSSETITVIFHFYNIIVIIDLCTNISKYTLTKNVCAAIIIIQEHVKHFRPYKVYQKDLIG